MSNRLSKEGLNQGKMRNTKQRKAIIEILKQANTPLTAEEIYSQLKAHFRSIAVSTIYRNLEILSLNGIVNKINIINDDRSRFELNLLEHKHHVICIDCKQMFTIDDCPFGKIEESIKKKLDFEVTSHRFEIYGYCSNCKN